MPATPEPAGEPENLGLGQLERQIMEIMWAAGSSTVREVTDRLRDSGGQAYTTVMTVMSRLARKGLLLQDASSKSYQYRTALTRQQFMADLARRRVRGVLANFGDLAVVQFVEQAAQVDPERLRRLLDLVEGERR